MKIVSLIIGVIFSFLTHKGFSINLDSLITQAKFESEKINKSENLSTDFKLIKCFNVNFWNDSIIISKSENDNLNTVCLEKNKIKWFEKKIGDKYVRLIPFYELNAKVKFIYIQLYSVNGKMLLDYNTIKGFIYVNNGKYNYYGFSKNLKSVESSKDLLCISLIDKEFMNNESIYLMNNKLFFYAWVNLKKDIIGQNIVLITEKYSVTKETKIEDFSYYFSLSFRENLSASFDFGPTFEKIDSNISRVKSIEKLYWFLNGKQFTTLNNLYYK